MPYALLLSPDDQAVSAITGVLEEMSVTCERPLDGVSAAQKLNSHNFDLVLVDCENLPAAKLIFDVCRRGKNGYNPVPIAIVDGRAGLPTAFRLGAELILTKPVSKDQARSTIRVAVARVRKEVPASAQPEAATEVLAQAAAAAAVSSPRTTFAESAPSMDADSFPTDDVTVTLSAPAVATTMSSAVADAEIETTPANPDSQPEAATSSAHSFPESSSTPAAAIDSNPALPPELSDDPVLAELERTEREESEQAELQPASESAEAEPAVASKAPESSSRKQGKHKTSSALVELLVLALAAGGFYAVWTYQPGFRALAQPQVNRVLALVGLTQPTSLTPSPAKPSAQLPATPAPAPAPADPNQAPAATPDSAASPAATSPGGAATTPAPAPQAAPPETAVVPPASGATTAPAIGKPEVGKPSDTKKDAATPSSVASLPGDNATIVLSSQGAEKRLTHSVPPKYPAAAHSGGTVVFKTFVDEDGKVARLQLLQGDATLAAAASEAVKQWSYRPFVRDGKNLPFQTVVTIDVQQP
ncbi:MAG: energy transducer TonB [Terriglobales bacterium]